MIPYIGLGVRPAFWRAVFVRLPPRLGDRCHPCRRKSGSRSHGGRVSFLGTESHARSWRHHSGLIVSGRTGNVRIIVWVLK
jgi:hypothetical protein